MPKIRVISASDVEDLLDATELRSALEQALVALAEGNADVPPRIAAHSRMGLLSAMPGYLSDVGLVTKLVTVFPANVDLPSHMGVIVCFDPETGLPLALMDGEVITRDRTACTASIATDSLARGESRVLTIVGAGVQGKAHLAFHAPLRDWDQIQILSRDLSAAESLVSLSGDRRAKAIEYSRMEEAIRASDVIALCTHAEEPVIRPEWVGSGTHVSSVGSSAELPAGLLRDAVIIVDHLGSVLTAPPAGAVELQDLDVSDVAELGALLGNPQYGRTNQEQITIYKSTGHAVQDVAASMVVFDRAVAGSIGIEVDI